MKLKKYGEEKVINRKLFHKKDIQFFENCVEIGVYQGYEQIPAPVIEQNEQLREGNDYVAYATAYRFETDKGIKYLVVRLNACENFIFEKYYAMNAGLNAELMRMLESTRAIRLVDGTVDFSAILYYNYQFSYKKDKHQNSYMIYDVTVDEDSYPANIQAFYDPDTVFDDLNWNDLEEGNWFAGERGKGR